MSNTETSTTCAACGNPIVQRVIGKEFCSQECHITGRTFCKYCNNPLTQIQGKPSKEFCNKICRNRYRSGPYNPSRLEERNRSTCKGCGEPITQPKRGGKQFCSKPCFERYRRSRKYGWDITQEWGNFAPEVRKSLREVQLYIGIGAAKRLATAIDREYLPRSLPTPRHVIVCHCRTCGKEFRRQAQGHRSRDYCSPECDPNKREPDHVWWKVAEKNANAKLTWEQVDQIRNLYAAGNISKSALGRKYGVHSRTVAHIIRYESWKPEDDPRRREVH